MSKTVDERVVSMEFDNKNFEKNVSTSLSTLDKLKQSLNLTGAAKGLENVDAAAKGVNMSPLSGAVETVRAKFSALEVMAVTALANITNSAVNTGKRMISALTIEPIKSGFQEYETQMNAVQTILANTQKEGTNVEIVNRALDELNAYADKTIYNFTEMTRNIGTFTAAGVKLDTSVSAIQGIANLAAVSGSTSQQASTAMYQLSQALASGTVKLMDWNSVVNAGMGGQVFQDALIRTAEHLGTGAKAAIAAKGSFRESLQTGWLTTEVLTQTLDQFATAADTEEEYEAAVQKFVSQGYSQEQAKQMADMARTAGDAATKVKTFTQLIDTLKEALGSGWTASWRIIVGDFEEAKKLWTEVSDYFSEVINKSAEARNNMLEGWKEGGGRTMAIEAIKNAFEGILNIVKPIKEAFREIFPRTTSEQVLKVTERIRNLTAGFKELTEKHAPKLKSTFKGLFAIIDIGVTFIKEIVSGIAKLIGNFTGLGDGVLGVTGSIGDWISKLRDSIKESGVFGLVIGKVVGFLQKAIDKIKEFGSFLKEKFLAPGFEGFLKVITGIWNVLKVIGGKIVEVGSKIGSVISNAFRSGDIKSGLDLLNGGIFAAILLKIRSFIKDISGVFDGAGGFLKGITETLDSVRGCFEQYQKNLKADMLKKIAVAIAILAAALFVIATIDPDRLNSSLLAVGALFGELLVAAKIFDKMGGEFKKAGKAATLMIGMSLAVLILAGALKQLANLDWEEIGKGLAGVGGLMLELVGAVKLLSNGGKKVMKGALQLVIFAAAIKILASVCKDLAALSWEELGKGLAGVGGLMLELSIFLNTTKNTKKAMSTALGILVLSAALKVLASVCKTFASMSWENIGKGLAAVGALLLELAVFTNITKNAKHVISTGVGLVLLAASMKILSGVMTDMSKLSWTEIAKGLTALGGSLLSISIAMKLLPKGIISKSLGLIGVAAAITILSKSLKSMSQMSWEEIAKGLVTLGGAMTILAIGLNAMKGTLGGSAAMLVAALAFAVFTPILKSLAKLSWGDIAKGLLALAGVFAVFGAAAAILSPIIPTMYALSGAILLFGVGCGLAGTGILALAIGLTALSASIVVAGNSIVEIVKGLINGIGDIIVSICKGIANSATAIAEAFIAVIKAACSAIIETVPLIAETLFELLVESLTLLKDYIPQIVNLLVDVVIALFDSLAARLPELSPSIANFIDKLITSIKDAFGDGVGQKILDALETVSLALLEIAVAAKIVSTINIAGATQGVAGLAIFVGGLAAILAVLGGLNQIPGFDWLLGEGIKVLGLLGTAIGTFVGNLVGSFSAGVTSGLPQLGQNLSDFMTNVKNFVEGAKSIDSSVVDGVSNLAKAVLAITGSNILSKISSWLTGGSSLVSFGKQLSEFGPYFKKYANSISGIDSSAVTASATAAKALAEMARVVPNEGGIAAWFAGENSLANFGDELVTFGSSLKSYSDSVAGVDPSVISASAAAAKALAEMADTIPNEGGVVAWFTGDNSIANFGDELVTFGSSLKDYADSVNGIDPAVIVASAEAAKALAEMADTVPNEGGIAAWFAGDNSLASFGAGIVAFGQSLKDYATSVAGIDPAVVIASAIAGKALAEMADTIPNEGGVVAWFAGDNSLASFGDGIVAFGKAMSSFSDSVTGIDVEAVKAAASAGKALAEMADTIPNEGGVVAWFAGENSLASFSDGIVSFGKAMSSFSDSVTGIDVEAVKAAASAGKTLAEMADTIPNEGGISAWFAGENSLASFSDGIVSFGDAMKSFSDSVTGIDAESVRAAANAGKTLAEMADTIPNEGGIKAWFAGENSMASFSAGIINFGGAMKSFSEKVTDIDNESVKTAANAGKTLAEMANTIPNSGGVAAWFAGENSMASFSDGIVSFGEAMKKFSDKVDGIKTEPVKAAVSAGKSLAELANTVPNSGGIAAWFSGDDGMASFSNGIVSFGAAMKSFSDEVDGISESSVKAAANAGKTLAEMADTIPKSVDLASFGDQVKKFGSKIKQFASEIAGIEPEEITSTVDSIKDSLKSLTEAAKNGISEFADAFDNGKTKVATAVSDLMMAIVDAAKAKSDAIAAAFKSIGDKALSAVKDFGLYNDFYNAGSNLVNGFANGITANTFKAQAKARAMAKAAYEAAKAQLAIHSPSKVFRKLGTYVPEGFAMGIDQLGSLVAGSAVGMADTAINGTRDAISRISDIINSDIDTQPTIRPVLDLSDVTSGTAKLSDMLNVNPSLGLLTNVGSISSMMNKNQNGTNSDVISAIKDLGRKIGNTSGDTYSINGITYDDGSNIKDAVQTIVRAARMERRM